ncbi:Uncharacterised protein [Sphingomonas paucimobilis]|nr:Uncharacterised protein [Sphingomonas paucimobilis]
MRAPLKGVFKSVKKLANGSRATYYYLRGSGALNPLEGDEDQPFAPGTPAFMRSYYAAIDAPRRARTAGTLQSVIDAYEKSPQFTKLAPRTQRTMAPRCSRSRISSARTPWQWSRIRRSAYVS